jgi:hypothetical protein
MQPLIFGNLVSGRSVPSHALLKISGTQGGTAAVATSFRLVLEGPRRLACERRRNHAARRRRSVANVGRSRPNGGTEQWEGLAMVVSLARFR